MDKYDELQNRICSGWNHWNTRSLLSHVHLPEAFAVNLGILSYAKPGYMKEALLGREDVVPGAKAYDGSYSDLTVTYCQTTMRVQTATDGEELVILVEPEKTAHKPALLTIESGVLWNRPGTLTRDGETLTGHFDSGDIVVHTTGRCLEEPNVAAQTPYLAIPLTASVGISTGSQRSLEEIRTIIADQRTRLEESQRKYAHKSETHRAAQACLAWNLIFDPTYDRAVMPVCRIWNLSRGGYVLFCWDTFFAAWLAAMDSKDLAYANCVEVLREKTPDGFVANNTQASGRKSFDRSQPPVGSITVLELFKRYGDRWFVEETFEDLLEWNRWWTCRDYNGYLCWGSTPFEPVTGDHREYEQPNTLAGAAYESGLDNSPMYDEMPFDTEHHVMLLADVGLMGLYVADCEALAELAGELGREQEKQELLLRADKYRKKLQTLWDEDAGLFLNKRLDTDEYEYRLSPTHFYPLLANAATPGQARRMIDEHFFNEQEFWGEWILPSIARNDPAYPDNVYWRGRIWAPMNFLVYLGLQKYDLPEARKALAERSDALLLKEWREHGHVHENYNADTGEGCDSNRSDPFYHWGGLLGLIELMEQGLF